jgi:ABC-2 type transport system permease protein
MALKVYKNKNRVLFGFTLKKNIKQAIIIGMMSSVVVVSSAIGFASAYPTEMSRQLVASTFESNTGLIALLGKPDTLLTIGGFTAWRSLGALTLIVSIWALFLSSRLFRGDEEQGRLELILTGKSSLVNATKQLFFAMLALLMISFTIIFTAASITSALQGFSWSLSSVGFLALTITVTALLFASIGMFVSQITATRAAALKTSAAIFGIAFMMRALGDISSSASWLSALSPLGWVARLHPLTSSNTVWLIPIFVTVIICFALSLFIASKRDYGASVIPDKDTAKPKYRLLKSGETLLFRLQKGSAILWIIGLFVANFMFGSFLSSVTEAVGESSGIQDTLNKVTNAGSSNFTKLFIGVIFIQMMLLLLIMVAGQINSFREEEARGYMDNMLVRQSSRLSLSIFKAVLIFGTAVLAAAAISLGMYLGAQSQDIAIGAKDIILSGINMLAMPAIFLGAGFLLFGFLPRLTSVLLYTIIGWTFIIEIIGSVINLNHWILDTSLLHHLALAPAIDVKWNIFWIYIGLGLVMAFIGIWRFTKRDIELM